MKSKGGDSKMNRPDKKEVMQAVKQLKKFGFENEDIASRLRVSVISINNYEKGKTAPNWPTYDTMLAMIYRLKKRKGKVYAKGNF